MFKWGTDDEWEFGLQRVINFPQNSLARKQNERTYLLKTLAGCPKDANKIERYNSRNGRNFFYFAAEQTLCLFRKAHSNGSTRLYVVVLSLFLYLSHRQLLHESVVFPMN